MSNFLDMTIGSAPGTARTYGSPAAFPAPPVATVLPTGATTSRDAQLADLAERSSSVNLLATASNALAAGGAGSADAPLLTLPPSPPMPAPAKPAATATDDNGQSNIVFSNADADGSLIR